MSSMLLLLSYAVVPTISCMVHLIAQALHLLLLQAVLYGMVYKILTLVDTCI